MSAIPRWIVTGAFILAAVLLLIFVGMIVYDRSQGRCVKLWGAELGCSGESQTGTSLSGIPSGVVLASWKDCASLGEDWSDFHHGQGRMIVGAGDPANNPYGDDLTFRESWDPHMQTPPNKTVGGEEQVTLEPEQMPKHRHQLPTDAVPTGRSQQALRDGDKHKDEGIHSERATYSAYTGGPKGAKPGQAAPHNNMPPYIALYFCKKE